MKYEKMLRKTLYHIAILGNKLGTLYDRISEEFEDCYNYSVNSILYNCKEIDGKLYNSKGYLLADSGLIDNKYYCNQWSGYCEDNYYGNMYYKIDDKGTFVEVSYEC